jgi:dTDP-D-glucose 4,6-dehydratase
LLNWQPEVQLSEGLRQTISYFEGELSKSSTSGVLTATL